MPGRLLRSALSGIVLGLLVSGPARAELSAQSVGDLLAAAVGATGAAVLTFGSATGNSDTVTLADVKLADSDGKGGGATVPSVVITGIAERIPGGFTAQRILFDGGTATARKTNVTWATGAVENVVIPTADEIKSRTPMRLFQALTVSKAQLAGGGLSSPIDVAGVQIVIGDVVADQPSTIEMKATGVRIPTALFSETVAGAIVGMLKYDEFLADVDMRTSYDPVTDTGTLETLTADVPSVGRISLAGKASAFSIAGITSPDAETAKEARANARLANFSLRLDNAGFVERMLDMQAEMLGGTRDDVRAALVQGALPFALSFIKNEAFRKEFQSEVAAFLEDPKSLTITASPAEPVPLGQVIRTAARSPMTLPDLLSPTVSANR